MVMKKNEKVLAPEFVQDNVLTHLAPLAQSQSFLTKVGVKSVEIEALLIPKEEEALAVATCRATLISEKNSYDGVGSTMGSTLEGRDAVDNLVIRAAVIATFDALENYFQNNPQLQHVTKQSIESN
jgi:translation initiation factor IF-2